MKNGQVYNPYQVFHGPFIPNWMLEFTGVSPTAKLIFGRLCEHAGKKGKAYPAQETLAREIGLSEKPIRSALKELERERLIRITRPKGASKMNHLTCHYEFIWRNDLIAQEDLRIDSEVLEKPLREQGDYAGDGEWHEFDRLPDHIKDKFKDPAWVKKIMKDPICKEMFERAGYFINEKGELKRLSRKKRQRKALSEEAKRKQQTRLERLKEKYAGVKFRNIGYSESEDDSEF